MGLVAGPLLLEGVVLMEVARPIVDGEWGVGVDGERHLGGGVVDAGTLH